jgi:hypothetical protein
MANYTHLSAVEKMALVRPLTTILIGTNLAREPDSDGDFSMRNPPGIAQVPEKSIGSPRYPIQRLLRFCIFVASQHAGRR